MRTPLCPDDRSWIDYREGRLALPEIERLEAHLKRCDRCRDRQSALSEAERQDPADGPANGPVAFSESSRFLDHLINDAIAEVEKSGLYRNIAYYRKGGMGIVLRAELRANVIPVVLKVFHPSYFELIQRMPATLGLRRFEREAGVGLSLQPHPRIIPIRSYHDLGTVQVIEMDPVEGIPLTEFLPSPKRPLKEEIVVEFGRMLADALVRLESEGVVHRDIKPDNCLVNPAAPRFTLRLLDFGIAKQRHDLILPNITEVGVSIGSPRFRAPEQTRDAAAVDIRADLYALGITLGWCLSEPAVFDAQERGVPMRTLDSASKPFRRVLKKLIEPARENRYASPKELLADLNQLVDQTRTRMARRSRLRSGVGATVVLTALVLAGRFLPSFWTTDPKVGPVRPLEIVPSPNPVTTALDQKGTVFANGLEDFTVQGEFRVREAQATLRLALREQAGGAGITLVVPATRDRRIRLQQKRDGQAETTVRDEPGEDLHLAGRWLSFKAELDGGTGKFWINERLVILQERDLPRNAGAIRLSGSEVEVRNVLITPRDSTR